MVWEEWKAFFFHFVFPLRSKREREALCRQAFPGLGLDGRRGLVLLLMYSTTTPGESGGVGRSGQIMRGIVKRSVA